MDNREVIINGTMLRAIRKARHLTQGQLGVKSGVEQSLISRFEKGKRTSAYISTIGNLALALGVSVSDLLVGPRTEWAGPENIHGLPMRRREDHLMPDRLRGVLVELELPQYWIDEIGRLVHLIRMDNEALRSDRGSA